MIRRANQFRLSEIMSSPKSKNISLAISGNQNYKPCHLIPEEGRRPSPPNVGMGCGGRGRRQACFFAPDETPTAYGEVVWSWRRDAGVKFVSKSSRATVANKPVHRGERGISRKTIAQGEPECFPLNLYARVRFLCASSARDRGCSAHPAFPAPSCFSEGGN